MRFEQAFFDELEKQAALWNPGERNRYNEAIKTKRESGRAAAKLIASGKRDAATNLINQGQFASRTAKRIQKDSDDDIMLLSGEVFGPSDTSGRSYVDKIINRASKLKPIGRSFSRFLKRRDRVGSRVKPPGFIDRVKQKLSGISNRPWFGAAGVV